MADGENAVGLLREKFPDAAAEWGSFRGQHWVRVKAGRLLEICRWLREDPAVRYEFLMDVTAVHWPEDPEPMEVVYHFFSLERNDRLRLKVRTGERGPEAGTPPAVRPGSRRRRPRAHGGRTGTPGPGGRRSGGPTGPLRPLRRARLRPGPLPSGQLLQDAVQGPIAFPRGDQDHDVVSVGKESRLRPPHLADETADSIAPHRVADLGRGRDAQPSDTAAGSGPQEQDEAAGTAAETGGTTGRAVGTRGFTRTPALNGEELAPATKPTGLRKTESTGGDGGHPATSDSLPERGDDDPCGAGG